MAKSIKKVLQEQLSLIKPPEEVEERIEEVADEFCVELKEKINAKKIKADVFIGGSVAKGTIIKKHQYYPKSLSHRVQQPRHPESPPVKKRLYDVDIFVRFSPEYNDSEISGLLGKVMSNFCKKFGAVVKVHGSRDYYQIHTEGILIEIIPVLKIKKPSDAVNVTDLSYFHVNYVLKKLRRIKRLVDDIRLAKTFVYAQGVYGAESYIHGFSGYALELLVLHFGSFEKFVREVAKMKVVKKEKVVIDDAGFYKNRAEVLNRMNQSKIAGPFVLVDPTFKDRNTLSGLSLESFIKLQKACKKFLKNPSKKFFEVVDVDKKMRKFKNVKIVLVRTNKQAGDIAGTKSKKFFDFFVYQLRKEFEVRRAEFEYDDESNLAKFYFVLGAKGEEIVRGPPVANANHLNGFKKAHPNAFIKKGFAYARVLHKMSFENWFSEFLKKEKKIMKEMGIRSVEAD